MKKYNDFLIRTKDKSILKFSYKEDMGIFYETIISSKIVDKNILFKGCLKYFYVFEDNNKYINLIYQDSIGNIILCVYSSNSSKYRRLFYSKHNFITPINMKGITIKEEFILFYNLDSNQEKVYFLNNIKAPSIIIYDGKNDIHVDFNILYSKDYISLIIYSVSFNIFKIILKTYNLQSKKWITNKNVFINNSSYIDMSFCIRNNKVYSLIVIDEDKIKSLIYKYNIIDKDEQLQREIILFQDKDISSCLILELDNSIWALWISEKKLYGCYSLDFGENFSKPSIYSYIIEEDIRKIQFIEGEENKEIYIKEINGKIILFLEELLKDKKPLNTIPKEKEIVYNLKEIENSVLDIKKTENYKKNNNDKLKLIFNK